MEHTSAARLMRQARKRLAHAIAREADAESIKAKRRAGRRRRHALQQVREAEYAFDGYGYEA